MAKPTETIESLVSDVLLLAYNAVWSSAMLTVRPIRTTYRLHMRLQNPRLTQIAPHSLLFLSLFATNTGYAFNAERLPAIAKSWLFGNTTPPEVRHCAVAAVAVLVTIDLLVRCIAAIFYRRDRHRRERFIKRALYAWSAQILYLNLAAAFLLAWGYYEYRGLRF